MKVTPEGFEPTTSISVKAALNPFELRGHHIIYLRFPSFPTKTMSKHTVKTTIGDIDGWEISTSLWSQDVQLRYLTGRVASWELRARERDHPPPHIHCWKAGAHVVVNLEDGLPYKIRSGKPKENDIRRLRKGIKDNMEH